MSKIMYEASGTIGFTNSSDNRERADVVKRAAISGASTDNPVVAAVTGKKIRVLSYTLTTASATTVSFEDGAGGTALTGVMTTAAGTPIEGAYNPHGHFETTAATLLNLTLGGAVQTSGHLTYVEVD